jgi:DNA-directed RNA polymerase I, II, and III subunit RPABC2
LREFLYLSSTENPEIVETSESADIDESVPEVNTGLDKALAAYRKMTEGGKDAEPLTEQQESALEKRLTEIEKREVVETIQEHDPIEHPCEKGKITIGPPTLTRFEKARIMGARALQLSLGAPPFIPIPKSARISLDIAMEELEQRVIPITIRRVLPNGDFQNIPIDYFD